MERKNLLKLGAVVAIAVAVVLAGKLFKGNPDLVACTMEAKLCPDGSAVGRQGPKCEFAPCPSAPPVSDRIVKVFYYNPARDLDSAGNAQCGPGGLVAVSRTIPFTNTPIQDSVRLLLTATPTAQERAEKLVSEFPLSGVRLLAASVTDGVLTLTFADPDHRTDGGSCFVSILRAQVEATAKQFGGIHEVRLMPTDLFQP